MPSTIGIGTSRITRSPTPSRARARIAMPATRLAPTSSPNVNCPASEPRYTRLRTLQVIATGWRCRMLSPIDATAPVAHTTAIHRDASPALNPRSAATATASGSGTKA